MIAAIKNGNEFAYEQAFFQLRGKVYHYFLKKTKSPEDANDLLQTTFLKLWQYRQSLSEAYSLDQHLFHMARTVFIDHIRKQTSRKNAALQLTRDAGRTETLQPTLVFDINSQLTRALEGMPALRQRVFILHRLEGYSYLEIAQLLSIPVKAVDNHLSRALRQLKKAFSAGLFFFIFCS